MAERGLTTVDYDAYAAGEATDEYDAVDVATPNRLHLPHALLAGRTSNRTATTG